MYRIVNKEVLCPDIFRMDIEAPLVARKAYPGNFVFLRIDEPGERIPLTVADFDRQAGTVTLVVQQVGRTTRQLGAMAAGDLVYDFVGPLGQPMEAEHFGTVVCVAGGVGVAPVFPQARMLDEIGNRVIAILGARTENLLFWVDRFVPISEAVFICTDDGSAGFHGFITQKLERLLDEGLRPDRVISIGPLPMMKATVAVTRPREIPTWVSLNPIMVDGTGMCGGCRYSHFGKTKFACVDGPDVDGFGVDFDEIALRNRRFLPQEKDALSRLGEGECRAKEPAAPDWLTRDFIADVRQASLVGKKQRQPMACQPADRRRRNWSEVALGYSREQAVVEAERCIQCKKPRCIAGCPVNIDIPRFIRELAAGDLAASLRTLKATNSLPAVCGRVCPQETQCEIECILGVKGEPIAIGRLERYVADWAEEQQVQQELEAQRPAPTGKSVAVIGAGPAGLTCAGDLVKLGHRVVVFEAFHAAGGVLRYGIPEFRLPKKVLDIEVDHVAQLGVEFRYNMVIGKVLTLKELVDSEGFDAVFVGTGAGTPSFMNIPGENHNGVYSANEFLTRVNFMKGYDPDYVTPVTIGRRAAVIGGGNTAMDCARTALRLGADEVAIVYRRGRTELPAREEEVEHAEEEGVVFHLLCAPTEIHATSEGWVEGMTCIRMELGEPDDSGRRRPVPLPGSEFRMDVDTVIVAIGQSPNPMIPRSTPELELGRWCTIKVDGNTQATSLPYVYAGGDVATGGATVIEAMGAGKRAATAIHAKLMGLQQTPATEAAETPA